MSGTKAGGKIAAAKNLASNPNFYREIGAIGGRMGNPRLKGFSIHPELASAAGHKGGTISRRWGVKNGQGKKYKQGVV